MACFPKESLMDDIAAVVILLLVVAVSGRVLKV
jgi:hypothetical protein